MRARSSENKHQYSCERLTCRSQLPLDCLQLDCLQLDCLQLDCLQLGCLQLPADAVEPGGRDQRAINLTCG